MSGNSALTAGSSISWESWREAPERARTLAEKRRRGDSIALTKRQLIAARRLLGDRLALSVTFGATSPKGRGFGLPAGAKIPLEPPLRGGFSLVLRFLFYPEQSAEQPPQTLGAFEHDHLHSADHLSLVFYAIIGGRGAECDSQLRIGPSGTVSTTTSAPFRVEMVMQSEPSAYSLLTPRG